jgi:hypothetical protein
LILRLPSHDRWLALGGVIVAFGGTLAAVQWAKPVGIAGFIVASISFVLTVIGVFTRDTRDQAAPKESSFQEERQKIGYRVHDDGKANIQGGLIRHQDIGIDVANNGSVTVKDLTIE